MSLPYDIPYTRPVVECKGKRYVIPDIHGCINTLKELIDKIQLGKDDQLFFLGDYIDRGPNSKGVIDFIMEMINHKYNMYLLIGNHDADILTLSNMYKNSNIINMIESSGSRDIFDENYNIFPEYITFYKHSCYYYELPNVWLVHAGFDFSSPNPFTNTFQMLWIRDMTYDEDMAKGKTIITGHTPRPIDIIKDDIKKSKKIISIDNGCVYKRFAGYGNLLCMDLSTFELIIQPNIDEY